MTFFCWWEENIWAFVTEKENNCIKWSSLDLWEFIDFTLYDSEQLQSLVLSVRLYTYVYLVRRTILLLIPCQKRELVNQPS